MDYPTYTIVNGKRYDINTDFRVAIECDRIAKDDSINDLERALAIIFKLFGEEALQSPKDYETLLEKAKKYLSCGEEASSDDKPDMDYIKDYYYIETSFRSDFGIDLAKEKMHWWQFYNYCNGLSNSEMGNCCVLNRIRNIRTMDTSDIKDAKTLQKIAELKNRFALEKKEPNVEQKRSAELFYEMLRRGD